MEHRIDIELNRDEHCPECGALWIGQACCGHCGCERELEASATIIRFVVPAAAQPAERDDAARVA
jgi:hypothetical protein